MPSLQDLVNAKFIDSFISLCNWLSDVCSQLKSFAIGSEIIIMQYNLSIIEEVTYPRMVFKLGI